MVNISHSAKEKYKTCPKMYKLHYIDKIRPTTTTSALLWGSAIDQSLNDLLEGNPFDMVEMKFESLWHTQQINGKDEVLSSSLLVNYFKSDLNYEIWTSEDKRIIEQFALKNNPSSIEVQLVTILDSLDKHMSFASKAEEVLFKKACWVSLRRKGLMVLDLYYTQILKNFNSIVKVQVPIEISSEDNTSKIIGFADFIAEYWDSEAQDFVKVVFDNKTASKSYLKDSVITSDQLSLYTWSLSSEYNVTKAGYVVINKKPRKHIHQRVCLKCNTQHDIKTRVLVCKEKGCGGTIHETSEYVLDYQIICDRISEDKEVSTIVEMETTVELIKAQEFPKNKDSCHQQFGKKCVYFDLCYKNDMTNLTIVESSVK